MSYIDTLYAFGAQALNTPFTVGDAIPKEDGRKRQYEIRSALKVASHIERTGGCITHERPMFGGKHSHVLLTRIFDATVDRCSPCYYSKNGYDCPLLAIARGDFFYLIQAQRKQSTQPPLL